MYKIYGISLLLAAILLHSNGNAETPKGESGIINGTLLQNLKLFPHQVGIKIDRYNESTICSGSILTHRWILTQGACMFWNPDSKVTLMFNRMNINISTPLDPGSFTIQINSTQHVYYSSNNYNQIIPALALIHLPVSLDFGIDIAPIALTINPYENFTGSYAVMAGIKHNTTQESYGQFEIMSDLYCTNNTIFFNATREFCTMGWQRNGAVPCLNTHGGGLLVDWPIAPRLVGVFALTNYPLEPAQYFKVSHFLDWIESMVGQRVQNTGYFV